MTMNLKDQAAIVGIGATEFSKYSGRSELQLACEAVSAAIDDAGLKPSEIDGMTTFTMDMTDDIEIARALGIGGLTFQSPVPYGGGAALGTLHQAAMAVATGSAKYVVCYRDLNGRSGQRYSDGVSGNLLTSDAIHWSWYIPSGLMTPTSWVAMVTQRYMHDTGTTSADLAEVAVQTRSHAVKNPNAVFYQRPLSIEEHQASRMIVDPLRLYDCCLETDGACACIVTTPERARDLAQTPAVIRGVAQGSGPDQEQMTSFYRPDITDLGELNAVARQIYAISGLTPDDIDAAILYDAFTAIVMFQLEAYGFCKRGEAKDFVKNGNISLGGRLPVNTHGGQLSEAYIHGMNGVNEGVRLVRGSSVNQPEKCDNVLVTAGVGVPSSAMIIGKPEA
jgi:acetyl-CoA acetyltransferase